MRALHASLTADEDAAVFKGGKYEYGVRKADQKVWIRRADKTGSTGFGRSIGQALDSLGAQS